MGKDVIIALDFPSAEETYRFLDQFTGRKPFVKIGMELFYAEGPQIVREIKKRGHKVFLDLKLHDIPNTVKGGMQSLRDLGVDMTNVHASGGIRMMKAAVEGLTREDGTRPILIAVTQLTSTSQETMTEELLIDRPIADDAVGDQARVTTPAKAREIGSDYIVVGRSITAAADPVAAYERAMADFVG